ncbi:prepilin-type N-terminal cleavage/methylation domain-containing protein [Lentisphaerota bacterium WC36G]|nr:prepilin-type N-terminal cleavage/methylation domain-containing protein [Lentisphaerae bacterium WC36]
MMMDVYEKKKAVRKAFSLIELIAVIAIIGLIGGLAIGGYSLAMSASKEAKTKSAMKTVATAFEAIKAKKGFYPQVTTGTNGDGMLNNVCWIATQDVDANNKPEQETLTCTLAFNPADLNSYVNKALAEEFVKQVDLTDFVKKFCGFIVTGGVRYYYLKDGWDNPVFYNSPGHFNPLGFDLISTGDGGYIGDPKPNSGIPEKLFDIETNQINCNLSSNEIKDPETYDSQESGGAIGFGTVDDIVNK